MEQNKELSKEKQCDIHVVSNSTELEKPTMEKYGWQSSNSFEEESGKPPTGTLRAKRHITNEYKHSKFLRIWND
jgi:hypothetical protein